MDRLDKTGPCSSKAYPSLACATTRTQFLQRTPCWTKCRRVGPGKAESTRKSAHWYVIVARGSKYQARGLGILIARNSRFVLPKRNQTSISRSYILHRMMYERYLGRLKLKLHIARDPKRCETQNHRVSRLTAANFWSFLLQQFFKRPWHFSSKIFETVSASNRVVSSSKV